MVLLMWQNGVDGVTKDELRNGKYMYTSPICCVNDLGVNFFWGV